MVTSEKTHREYAKEKPKKGNISIFKKKIKHKGKKETDEPKIIKTTHKGNAAWKEALN